ncbi:MAG TPA: AAA family ATPase [Myxococcota bacterium]|nr:AAA family ATPase [Myxococcota bacterium]
MPQNRPLSNVTRLHLHEDFVAWLGNAPPPQRAAALRALEALIAHGRPNRVKGARGVNQGWLRTPVGGTNGMQFYLWFAASGSTPVGDSVGSGQHLIRAVRHHDDTSIRIEASGQTMPWSARDLFDELGRETQELEAQPHSEAQRRAMGALCKVHLVLGSPGAGKTTALLHSLRRLEGRVLYVTFSASLAQRAREWCDAVLEDAHSITIKTFGELLPSAARDPSPELRRARLWEELAQRLPQLGPWVGQGQLRADELYDELHAHYFGSGGELDAHSYQNRRSEAIGKEAAATAARAASWLSERTVAELFPGPCAARRPPLSASTCEGHDWVVVDEVQDLTEVELAWLVAEVDRASNRPGLRAAGDEGQTLRPTGFTWAGFKRLLGEEREVNDTKLSANLRSTREIAQLIVNLTSHCYRDGLPRALRPGGQGQVDLAPVEGGECQLVTYDEPLDELVRKLARLCIIVEVGPGEDSALARTARAADARYFTSESGKGLDFETVAVFGLGEALETVARLRAEGQTDALALERLRSLADHMRVAISRSVSRLVLFEPSPALAKRVMALADTSNAGAEPVLRSVTTREALDHMTQDTGDALTGLTESLALCESLLERDPEAALHEADKALAAFRRAGRAQAVGAELRKRVFLARGRARSLFALRASDTAMLKQAQSDFREANETETARALGLLIEALKLDSPSKLSEHIGQLDQLDDQRVDPWLATALREKHRRGLEPRLPTLTAPLSVTEARKLRPRLDALAAYLGNEAVASLRLGTLEVLVGSKADAKEALEALETWQIAEAHIPRLRATALETLSLPGASEAWIEAGEPARAVDVLRELGAIREASELSRRCGIEPPSGLALAEELLILFERLDGAALTDQERASLKAKVPSWLGSSRRK